jgi:serine/threonine protein kinase
VQPTETPTLQVRLRRTRCAKFERRKRGLYEALKRLPGDCVVRIDDFFVSDGHYFTVSEYIDPAYPSFESLLSGRAQAALPLLASLAECLRALHDCGVVHADLKPEHVMIADDGGTPRIRLIDFDAGFLESSPPEPRGHIEVDPVYLAPEAYLLMTGKRVRLNRKLDTFAFGILMHLALTGKMPGFYQSKYTYLYACVLDGGKVNLSDELNPVHRSLIRRMLKKSPARRPGDREICKILDAAP